MWALNTNCVIVFEYQTQSLFRKESINFYQKKLFFQKLIRKQKIMKQLLQGLLPQKTAQPCKTLKLQFHRLWCYNSYCDWLPHFEIISSKNIVKHKKVKRRKKERKLSTKFFKIYCSFADLMYENILMQTAFKLLSY